MSTKESSDPSNTAPQSQEKPNSDEQSRNWRNRILNSKFFNDNSATEKEKWGYDLYPERKQLFKTSLSKILKMQEGREPLEKMRCEENVYECAKSSHLVKLMMSALKSAGCPLDLRRHISCEVCDDAVTGGYDPELNQIIICQNTSRTKGFVQGVLTHEMVHMFDYCTNDLDFKNVEHLACTEIRAANLAHCSFLGAYAQTDADFFNIKKRHQDCVKSKAVYSVLAVRKNINKAEAIAVVEKVFPKCYADLEPIGRRIRSGSADAEQAYAESKYYGYS